MSNLEQGEGASGASAVLDFIKSTVFYFLFETVLISVATNLARYLPADEGSSTPFLTPFVDRVPILVPLAIGIALLEQQDQRHPHDHRLVPTFAQALRRLQRADWTWHRLLDWLLGTLPGLLLGKIFEVLYTEFHFLFAVRRIIFNALNSAYGTIRNATAQRLREDKMVLTCIGSIILNTPIHLFRLLKPVLDRILAELWIEYRMYLAVVRLLCWALGDLYVMIRNVLAPRLHQFQEQTWPQLRAFADKVGGAPFRLVFTITRYLRYAARGSLKWVGDCLSACRDSAVGWWRAARLSARIAWLRIRDVVAAPVRLLKLVAARQQAAPDATVQRPPHRSWIMKGSRRRRLLLAVGAWLLAAAVRWALAWIWGRAGIAEKAAFAYYTSLEPESCLFSRHTMFDRTFGWGGTALGYVRLVPYSV